GDDLGRAVQIDIRDGRDCRAQADTPGRAAKRSTITDQVSCRIEHRGAGEDVRTWAAVEICYRDRAGDDARAQRESRHRAGVARPLDDAVVVEGDHVLPIGMNSEYFRDAIAIEIADRSFRPR